MARVVTTMGAVQLGLILRKHVEKPNRWISRLTKDIEERFKDKRPSLRALANYILRHPSFKPVHFLIEEAPSIMNAAEGRPREWNVPSITTVGDLAYRLNLSPGELDWFSDCRTLERDSTPKLCHYRRRWVQKRDGTFRLIESPKQRLKAIQRSVLVQILERIPSHEVCHGFRTGRSILSFAQPHASKTIVLKMDLKDFFPTCSFSRVQNIFLTAGYPESVAMRLAGLCTTICPRSVIAQIPRDQQRAALDLYVRKHLPQGAPSSPMLANLCAFNLDCRLNGLAQTAGGEYTRYADDLVFSGNEQFARGANRFLIHAMAVALEEGFVVNARKTRLMRQSVAQRAAGLTLNVAPNIPRADFDRLKAILTNCIKLGPSSQNRDEHSNFRAHLEGHIAHVVMINPERGAKLKRIFDQIRWDSR